MILQFHEIQRRFCPKKGSKLVRNSPAKILFSKHCTWVFIFFQVHMWKNPLLLLFWIGCGLTFLTSVIIGLRSNRLILYFISPTQQIEPWPNNPTGTFQVDTFNLINKWVRLELSLFILHKLLNLAQPIATPKLPWNPLPYPFLPLLLSII